MTDYNAHEALKDNKEQVIRDAHARRRAAKELDEVMRKERLQEMFWRKVYWSTMILLAMVITYYSIKGVGLCN